MDLVAAALDRPRVRVNQVGYRTDGPKAATVITDAVEPLPVECGGWTGLSLPAGTDSGFGVHTVDFSGLRSVGTFRLRVGDLVSHPFPVGPDPYAGLLGDAVGFLYAQRSGGAIDDAVLPGYGRPAGHAGVPPNQGDTAVGGASVYPGWRFDGPVDVSGGWYDAGDHGKYVTSGALPAAMLLAAAERHPAAAPAVLAEARWQVDWLLRMQVPAGVRHAGLAFHRVHDDRWTPLPMWPHLDPAPRVLHRPSTGAGLHLAATAAHAARVFAGAPGRAAAPGPGTRPLPGAGPAQRDRPRPDPRLLAAARAAWAAAEAEPDLRAPDDAGAHGGGPYHDDDRTDDRYWAATELYLTTGEPAYRDAVTGSPGHTAPLGWVEFDDLTAWARIELALHAPELGTGPSVVARADELLAVQARQPWGQPYAPDDGWDWGSTGRILGALLILTAAHHLTGDRAYAEATLRGLDYVFGRNPVGLSYVTGWGTETAHRQRVRHFAHALDPAYPPPPRGAVAGGPASRHYPGFPGDPRFAGLPDQLCYVDEPTSETTNDVCIRWDAPLALLAAGLLV